MSSKAGLEIALAFLLVGVSHASLGAENIKDLKKGVVKITAQVEGKTKVGTGFIVRVEKNAAYIVTAAHVIEGDPQPQVTFQASGAVFEQGYWD